jgi:predicted signal transduction protein with EAL and GGDEF domain
LARIGGNEFIVIMGGLQNIKLSSAILERLLKATSDPIMVDGAIIRVSASIGVTFYPQDNSDADHLMRQADQAMYNAKQAGKNRYRLFDVEQAYAGKIQLENIDNIRLAKEQGEFLLHYQPKVNMRTGEVIGTEALIRWQHPKIGLIPSLDFLPVMEGHPQSLEIGEWVIDTALNQISDWQSLGISLPISVNISAYRLQQDNFVNRLKALLASYPEVSPPFLELEILETIALHDINQVSATMNECHKLGVRFALDDFGTGYLSLTHSLI